MQRGNKRSRKPARGLGDTIEQITTATGIKAAVKWAFGEDCGCDERKEKLNKLFPYKRPACLNEQEHIYLSEFFQTKSGVITAETQRHLLNIYNRVFNVRKKATGCAPCVRSMVDELKQVFDNYATT